MRPGTALVSQPHRGNGHRGLRAAQTLPLIETASGATHELVAPPVEHAKCAQAGCKHPVAHSGSHDFHIRPSRAKETSEKLIEESRPYLAGGLARRPWLWMDAVGAALTAAGRRKRVDGAETVRRVAIALKDSVGNWVKATTRPTVARLAAAATCTERQVRRVLRWLREHGLLSLVATGRSADYAKADGAGDAAVYALWMPASSAERASRDLVRKEIDVRPTPFIKEYVLNPTRESADFQTDSLRETVFGANEAPGVGSMALRIRDLKQRVLKRVASSSLAADAAPLEASRRLSKRERLRKQRVGLAELLIAELEVLRRPYVYQGRVQKPASSMMIAAAIRLAHKAGMVTTKDIIWALEHLPSGPLRPYSFDGGVKRPDLWLKNRLADWLDADGHLLAETPSIAHARVDAAQQRNQKARQAQAAAIEAENLAARTMFQELFGYDEPNSAQRYRMLIARDPNFFFDFKP